MRCCSRCRARRSSTTATRSGWATTSTSAIATASARRCSGPADRNAGFSRADPARLYAPLDHGSGLRLSGRQRRGAGAVAVLAAELDEADDRASGGSIARSGAAPSSSCGRRTACWHTCASSTARSCSASRTCPDTRSRRCSTFTASRDACRWSCWDEHRSRAWTLRPMRSRTRVERLLLVQAARATPSRRPSSKPVPVSTPKPLDDLGAPLLLGRVWTSAFERDAADPGSATTCRGISRHGAGSPREPRRCARCTSVILDDRRRRGASGPRAARGRLRRRRA